MKNNLDLRWYIVLLIVISFITNTLAPLPLAKADDFYLPQPGVIVPLSAPFNPPILKGIKVHPDNPFKFEFILDQGDTFSHHPKGSEDDTYNRHPERSEGSLQEQLKTESTKLIKYFLASLTIPEKDLRSI